MTKAMQVEHVGVGALKPYVHNARTHSKKQIKQIATSIERFGFTNPVLVSDAGQIIAGHGRVEAAKLLGLKDVPTIRLSHLSEAQRRAYILADNKLASNAGWDKDMLAIELRSLIEMDFEVELTGFSVTEVDLLIDDPLDSSPAQASGPEDEIAPLTDPGSAVTRSGDVWVLGPHRLICGDARDPATFEALLQGRRADVVFTDPPSNALMDGHPCGLGRTRHEEFGTGLGKMSSRALAGFLAQTLGNAANACRDGAIAFVCMDWPHMGELMTAGQSAFSELMNLCVWSKTIAGMGRFYRSKHELVFVFKVGTAPHTTTVGLGDTGRYRTDIWDYAGVDRTKKKHAEEPAVHRTVKPVALVVDAIKDCSKRGETVLDPFAGSGTTLIAAQMSGRSARAIESDPVNCDAIVRRFERVTGKQAKLLATGDRFETTSKERAAGR